MEHASMTSIKLANGCVVRVGDVVPMTDGTKLNIIAINGVSSAPLRLKSDFAHRAYGCDGLYRGMLFLQPAIDLAALAEQQAATAQPGATVREMVKRWKRRTDAIQRAIDAGAYTVEGQKVMESIIEAINTCAAELAAALPGGEGVGS